MKTLYILLCATCTAMLAQGQSALHITNTYQQRDNIKRHVTTKLLNAAKEEIQSGDHSHVMAYNCSGDGWHHAQGKSNALLHLDSLTQGSIPPPLTESRWKMETKHLMSHIIQSDFPVLDGQLDIHIYADDLDTAQLKQDLLMPLALSLGLLDEQGNMLSRFTVTVHHQFSSENGASHFSITSL